MGPYDLPLPRTPVSLIFKNAPEFPDSHFCGFSGTPLHAGEWGGGQASLVNLGLSVSQPSRALKEASAPNPVLGGHSQDTRLRRSIAVSISSTN